ncbi:MAG: hypothetical protein RL140_605 [Actinomycetota bacterium]|jgi:uncharacterized membrane protein YhaH (DUF805 family)
MKFIEAIKFGFKNYVNFKGVVDRATFWQWALFLAIGFGITSALFPVLLIFLAAVAIPTFALMVRRYRDAGVSRRWLMLWLIPVLAAGPIFSTIGGSIFNNVLSGPGGNAFRDTGIAGAGIVLGLVLVIAMAIIALVYLPVVIVNIIFLSKPSKK